MNPADKIFSYLARKQFRSGGETELFQLFFTHPPKKKSIRHKIMNNLLLRDGRFSFDRDSESWHATENELALNIHEAEYSVIDIETTGFNSLFDRITEIAIIKLHKGEIAHHIESLVNPRRSLPVKLQRLTGIQEHMIIDKPPFENIIPIIKDFINDTILVAHHSSFDIRFINAELQRCGHESLPNMTLCTCALARRLYPNLHSYSLDALADYFGFSFVSRHRAYGDALMALHLLKEFLKELNNRSITTIDDLIGFLAV